MKFRGAIAASLVLGSLGCQTLLQDIRAGFAADNPGSSPQTFATVGTVAYFSATDGIHGAELWRSDGTYAGTALLRDVRKGPGDSRPLSLTAWGNTLLFAADDGEHGYEPWISDGTTAGTRMLVDLLPGNDGRIPVFVPAGPAFFILTQSLEANGNRIWKSDGTASGTTFVGAFPFSDAAPPATAVLGGKLLMMVTNQLWISDGTQAGTVQIATVGSLFRTHRFLAVVGSVGLFEAEDATHGNELWRTDGTVTGTAFLAELTPGTTSSRFFAGTVLGTDLVFGCDDTISGSALWKSDGTAAGTQRLRAFPTVGFGKSPYLLGVVGTRVLFLVDDGVVGFEPWTTDGTSAGTQLLLDISPGASGCGLLASFGTTANGLAFFVADDQTHGQEPWVTDGTPAGTHLVADLEAGPTGSDPLSGTPLGNQVIFAPRTSSLGTEPWISDGTPTGTMLVREIRPATPLGSDAYGFATLNGLTYFVADDGVHGREPWQSDGTPPGTRLCFDSQPGLGSPNLTGWIRLGDRLLSFANLGSNHAKLVSWDGIATSYQVLADPAGTATVGVATQTLLGIDRIYFRYSTLLPQAGSLWRSDGTAQGTVRLWQVTGDIVPFATFGNRLLFGRSTGGSTYELWDGDGTQAGSTRLATFQANINQAPASDFVQLGTRICFLATNANRTDLWCSDGTAAGTVAVTDPTFGSLEAIATPGRATARLVQFAGGVWFTSQMGTPKQRLWVTNGTRSGCVAILDSTDACPPMFTIIEGRMLFAASSLATGRELWSTDGTFGGTVALPELVAGPIGGLEFTESITPLGAGNVAVLAAHDGVHGSEPWCTDGQSWLANFDIWSGPGSSAPSGFQRLGDRVLFVADDGTIGREPFVLGAHDLGVGFVDDLGGGCPGSGDRIPSLRANSAPRVGHQNFAIGLEGGFPNAAQAWVLGPTSLAVPLPGGCTSFVGPSWLVVAGRVDARGATRLALPVPHLGSLVGADLYVQAAVADPRGSYEGKFSFSPALRVYFGR